MRLLILGPLDGHFGTAGIDSPASFTGGLSEPDKKPVIRLSILVD